MRNLQLKQLSVYFQYQFISRGKNSLLKCPFGAQAQSMESSWTREDIHEPDLESGYVKMCRKKKKTPLAYMD
jgi:hypothetical protein